MHTNRLWTTTLPQIGPVIFARSEDAKQSAVVKRKK